jgi:quinone-modifying oxidoreductase subunit QmoA
MNVDAKPILVIGGGIAGMTAALEAAEVGYSVILVEKEAFLGGRVVRTYRYFPKLCPPTCGFEVNVRRIRRNPRITVHTLATVEEVTGKAPHFRARIRIRPRYVTGEQPIDDSVVDQLTSERPNDFNLGMDKTKALYMPHDMAWPHVHVLDKEALSDADAETLKQACPPGAIDFDMQEKEIEVDVGAVILATGWSPYDATKIDNLGFGRFPNVVTNVMMERMAALGGPTGGSRDVNHLPYCSSVCCMASLKQARFLREKNESAKATVFYIDIRTIGYLEKFYYDMLEDEGVSFVKGKVAEIHEDSGSHDLTLDVEDTLNGQTLHESFDLVVLATGIVPNRAGVRIPFELKRDEYGFVDGSTDVDGVYAAGCVKRPCDVSRTTKDATSAALRAIQCLNRGE